MEKVLIIIPARGGSKGLPGKNIKNLNGKPLLAYTIEQATIKNFESRIVVSTDSSEIAGIAEISGAESLIRPLEISGDTATSESALIHALNHYESLGFTPNYICFLQCTSPVRRKYDVQKAIELLIDEKSDSLLSVSPNHRFIWKIGKQGPLAINYDFNNRKRRQDLEPEFVENGSIYVFKPWVLKKNNNRLGGKVSLYVMPEDSSYEIDSAFDFFIIENLMKELGL